MYVTQLEVTICNPNNESYKTLSNKIILPEKLNIGDTLVIKDANFNFTVIKNKIIIDIYNIPTCITVLKTVHPKSTVTYMHLLEELKLAQFQTK
jgi:hypothetical protein